MILSCCRYQREEAKIQAWVNLENAKAEVRSKKLEVFHCLTLVEADVASL